MKGGPLTRFRRCRRLRTLQAHRAERQNQRLARQLENDMFKLYLLLYEDPERDAKLWNSVRQAHGSDL